MTKPLLKLGSTFLFLVLGALLASFVNAKSVQQTAQQPSAQSPKASEPMPDVVDLGNQAEAKRVPYKPGDICLACNNPIHEHDPVYVVNGQRIPIHQQEVSKDLPGQLKQLLALIQPRGAFIGAQQAQRALSNIWFWSGLYILVGLVFGAFCAHRALQTGYGALGWFLAGLAINVFAFLALRMRPRREIVAPAGIPPGLGKIAATYSPEAMSTSTASRARMSSSPIR